MAFSLFQRIYYENTDIGGVMFHAEYMRFFERARTEYLRSLDISVAELATKENDVTIFVVKHLEVDYLKPVFLEDYIEITANIIEKSLTSILFEQNILRDGQILTRAKILCVATNKNGKPKKINFL